MKRGTPEHLKMKALARRLSIPLPHAVGIMEMLWHYVGKVTPRGDIGAAADEDIEQEVYWPSRKAGVLIEALVVERWLDRDDKYRLVVHDWPDHCEDSVRKSLRRNRKDFLPVYGRSVYDKSPPHDRTCPAFVETGYGQVPDSVSLSRGLGMARQGVVEVSGGGAGGGWIEAGWRRFLELWERPCDVCTEEHTFPSEKSDLACTQWVSLCSQGRITEENLDEVLAGLTRFRASKRWHDQGGKYVVNMADWLGWPKDGMLQEPRWNDRPAALVVGEY